MISVRRALTALGCVALVACGGASEPPVAPSGPPLHLVPSTDLAQGAGLSWLIDVLPKALTAHADLLPAIDAILSRAQVTALAARNGGVDPLAMDEVVVASYSMGATADDKQTDTTLYIARGSVTPDLITKAFRAQADVLDGRSVDREDGTSPIVRTWGTVHGERAQVATFGSDGVALEVGHFGPLRATELFAQERLKRAVPALRVGPLARAADLLRDPNELDLDPPLRAFALGPFEGVTARGLGGLLAGSTAAAIGARPATVNGHSALACTLILTGGWGGQAEAAAERLRAAFDALSATALARLAGLDRPLSPVRVVASPDALRLTVALDPLALGRGARAAMGAEISEIMAY